MGTPNNQTWPGVDELKDFNPEFPKWPKIPLNNILLRMPDSGIDLVTQMLDLNPNKRISASKGLESNFFSHNKDKGSDQSSDFNQDSISSM